jgi:hypothetical protein
MPILLWHHGTGYTDLGCYMYVKEGPGGRTDLTGSSADKMTPAECYRLSGAYDYFGVVGGNRCIGFDTLWQAAVIGPTESAPCSMPCAGAAATSCGGKASVRLYARNKPVPQLAPATGEGGLHEGRESSRCATARGCCQSSPCMQVVSLHRPVPVPFIPVCHVWYSAHTSLQPSTPE